MPAPYAYQFDRKPYNGGYAKPNQGEPSLVALLETRFPGRSYKTQSDGADLVVCFRDEPELTAQEQTDLTSDYDGWEPFDLATYQAESMLRVDAKTESNIVDGPGFEWPPASGKRFSLTLPAQTKWTGLKLASAAMTYPFGVTTKDDSEIYEIADAAEVDNMYLTAVGTIDAIMSAGRDAKQSVRDATTKAAIDTILSNYGA